MGVLAPGAQRDGVVAKLRAMLVGDDPDQRAYAAEALLRARILVAEEDGEIVEVLADPDLTVGGAVARALWRAKGGARLLKSLVSHPDPRVRAAALQGVSDGAFGPRGADEDLLFEAARSEHAVERRAAAELLGPRGMLMLGDDDRPASWLARLMLDDDAEVREAALAAALLPYDARGVATVPVQVLADADREEPTGRPVETGSDE